MTVSAHDPDREGTPARAAAIEELLATVDDTLEGLVGLADDILADGEVWARISRQSDVIESLCCRSAAAAERAGLHLEDGARSAGVWLARRCHQLTSVSRRRVRIGRSLRTLPLVAAEFGRGELGASQVAMIAALDRPGVSEALHREEEMLVDHAKQLPAEQFGTLCQYFAQLADEDGSTGAAERRRARRDVTLTPGVGGTWLGSMTLDPISGEIVAGELHRLSEQLFSSDWRAARERLGRDPLASELDRTPAQRRADALVEMATRSATAHDGAKRPVPLFEVLVDFPTFQRMCELASGTVVTPASLVPFLDPAWVERAVWRGPTRVEVGTRTRLFTGATRRAIELRDRRCTHPYCDEPVQRCQVDHIVPYSEGGETTQENGRLLCARHNRQRVHDGAAARPGSPPRRRQAGEKRDPARRGGAPGGAGTPPPAPGDPVAPTQTAGGG